MAPDRVRGPCQENGDLPMAGYGISRIGLDLDNVHEFTEQEKNANLLAGRKDRGPMYQLWCNELIDDYASPEWVKLHSRATRHCDAGGHDEYSQPDYLIWSVHNLTSYIVIGWETGIRNEFFALWRHGLPKDQTMEIVMFAQLYAGMRGLGHVYRAVGDFLPVYSLPKIPNVSPDPAVWPAGWAPDPEAFKSGLDLSKREMTAEDRQNLESWYEQNIGYVPKSIQFGIKHNPEFVKVNRAKWEVSIRTLPKQVAPYIMLKMNALSQNRDGLRESALLAKSWGITKPYIRQLLNGVVCYFAGFEGYYAPADAIDDVLDSMD
jgi:hypothetical protein